MILGVIIDLNAFRNFCVFLVPVSDEVELERRCEHEVTEGGGFWMRPRPCGPLAEPVF